MARLLSNSAGDPSSEPPGPLFVYIGGEAYANSAAKFWIGLVDELVEDFNGCDACRLTCLSDRELIPDFLSPASDLERHAETYAGESLEDLVKRLSNELELFGPPGAVHIELGSGDRESIRRELPREAIDADVFPYLLVWLLEWSDVPHFLWNTDLVEGAFDAIDRLRGREYRVAIKLESHHVQEGLYRRSVRVQFERRTWAPN